MGTPIAEAAAKKPPAEKKSDGAEERTGAARMKVETELDRKQFARTAEADSKRDEAIEELKKLIPRAPEGRKSEMIFRLAELYWQKSKYNYGVEMQEFERAFDAWADSGRKSKEPTLTAFTRQSELIKQNALRLYEKVLAEYPTYRRNDEVLFYLGYNEYEAGNIKRAVSHYWTLIKRFPKSRLVPDAYLQLGEHFFNTNRVNQARRALERALATKSQKVYNYALYKLSWCDYNVQEYAAGIKKLKEVIDRSEVLATSDKAGVQLKSEALGDLARFFSYVDEVEGAFAYFKEKGGEEIAIRYTTKLGELFHGQGKWTFEIASYRMLNDRYPMASKAPALQSRIVAAYSKLNKKDQVRTEVERLVDLYRPGTPWYKHQESSGDAASLEYAYDLTETNLRDLVTEYHRDAQKRKDVPTYHLARDIYAKYLEAFSASESAYQMRFFYSEVLWALKEWKNAAAQYDLVARMQVAGKRGRYARNAAYNAILAWEKIVAEGAKGDLGSGTRIVEKKGKKGKVDRRTTRLRFEKLQKDKTYEPKDIPDSELKLSAACDLYFDIADKKDKDLPAIKFKAAFIYYKYNQFVEAATRYNEVIERWPGTDLSKKSANLILDSLNVQKKWDELEKYARGFRGNKRLVGRDKKFLTQVEGIVQGASFKAIMATDALAQKIEADGERRSARADTARRFRAFHTEFPRSQYAATAVFNSLLIYDKADELDNAIEAGELLLSMRTKAEKKSKRKKRRRRSRKAVAKKGAATQPDVYERAHFLLAGFFERIANYKRAARLYSSFYDRYKGSKSAADAVYNAGVFQQGMGNSAKAIGYYTEYMTAFKTRSDVASLYWRICEIRDEEKQWKESARCWDDYRSRFKKADRAKVFESRYRLALAYEALSKRSDAMKVYRWLLKEHPKLKPADRNVDGVRLAGAHAAFELLEPEFSSFKRLKITLRKKSFLAKAAAAEALACVSSGGQKCKKEGRYLSVLSYGNGDYGIAALARMGMVFRNMAQSIREAPLPRSLTEDQLEIYRAELDNVALGPDEKALEAFENALAKAYELNIYNEWTLKAQDGLKELNPDKFPDPQSISYRGASGFATSSLEAAVGAAPAPVPEAPKAPAAQEPTPAGASAS